MPTHSAAALIACRVPCPQDYWEGSNGIFDVYFQSKGLDLAAITSMNSAVSVGTTACRRPSVLLLLRCSHRCPDVFQLLISEPGDNMPNTTAGAPQFQLHYSSKETLATSVHVSNYGGADIKGGKIDWKVVGLSAGKAHHFIPIRLSETPMG